MINRYDGGNPDMDIFFKKTEEILYKIYRWFMKLIRVEPSEKFDGIIKQFIGFGVVGLTNTIISYVLYVLGLKFFNLIFKDFRYNYLLAQVVAFVLSVLWSYYWNNKVVFESEDNSAKSTIKRLAKTFASYAFTGLFLSAVLLYLWVDVVGISEYIAPIINLIITVPLNFIINKFWAFKK